MLTGMLIDLVSRPVGRVFGDEKHESYEKSLCIVWSFEGWYHKHFHGVLDGLWESRLSLKDMLFLDETVGRIISGSMEL